MSFIIKSKLIQSKNLKKVLLLKNVYITQKSTLQIKTRNNNSNSKFEFSDPPEI